MTFTKKIEQFVQTHRLLRDGDRHLVALSGGADSVALLLVLKELGYQVEAAHCNFRLRGEEADRDEAFCVELCKQHAIPLHRIHFDTREYAALHKVSIEMAARELRYHYFGQLVNDLPADTVCVAHHKEDSVETLLINLLRGTGIHGLQGIAPKNGNIVRPLLCVNRTEIEDYLKNKNQHFVTDSTNFIPDVVRNKIRLEVLPLLETITPAAQENIFKTSQHVVEATKVFDKAIQQSADKVTSPTPHHPSPISIPQLLQEPSPEYTLYYILKDYHFSPAQVEQIYDRITHKTGAIWQSPTHELAIDRDQILVQPIPNETGKILRIPEDGTYRWDEHTLLKVARQQLNNTSDWRKAISKDKESIALDAGKLRFPLSLRHPQEGDRFRPFGMKGTKLLSDYMTDRKYSIFDKRRQLVLTDANDHILWLVGERPDDRFRLTEETSAVLSLRIL